MYYYAFQQVDGSAWKRVGPVFSTETAATNWIKRHPNKETTFRVHRTEKLRGGSWITLEQPKV